MFRKKKDSVFPVTKDEKHLRRILETMEKMSRDTNILLVVKTDAGHALVGQWIHDKDELIRALMAVMSRDDDDEARDVGYMVSTSLLGAMMCNDELYVKFDELYNRMVKIRAKKIGG